MSPGVFYGLQPGQSVVHVKSKRRYRVSSTDKTGPYFHRIKKDGKDSKPVYRFQPEHVELP